MRNQEFLLLLSLGFFICIPCLARNLKKSCPPSSCGDLHNIRYPFRLKDDPLSCGNPDFELSCVANQTVLLIQNMTFYVKEINYTSGNLRIMDVGLANDTCPFPHYHTTINQFEQDDRFCFPTIEDPFEQIVFVICSQVFSDGHYIFIPCASTAKEKVHVAKAYELHYLQSSCRRVASVPVNQQDLSVLDWGVNFSSSVAGVLTSGFSYEWSEKRRGCNVTRFNSSCIFNCLKIATSELSVVDETYGSSFVDE
ncbi:hypothetical protein QJS10_CPB14g00233 [Acorus calamus]|uniref:Wall-associated receptor kinase galacturonan-binding domain-containing protein n=1 Tax=Acorus calamus TaxID=4465 RepID=A0AAV9DDX6_ACOCL|nr:hypothetical protein QJS10_CPB14g00233 [Acorus calamus]